MGTNACTYKYVHTRVHTSHANTSLVKTFAVSLTLALHVASMYVLESVGSLSHGTPVVNLTIVSACGNDIIHILCTNGANMAFTI